ncbi:MAG TPA: S1 RNA-binding domain-containing protein, partial [Cyclobacteriaceae bacterium]|nr:S1 RNA-binding domain-containing protein [Cyclobacteriaceae bacterium]
VHLSHLADRYISDPNEVVTVNQKVEVTVMEVDIPRKRIGLSMKKDPFAEKEKPRKDRGQRPRRKQEKAKDTEEDMAAKLALLKSKFGG